MKIYAIILLQFLGINLQPYNVDQEKDFMTVSGTSSLHDWESTVEDFKFNASLAVEENTVTISELEFTVAVKSVKSGKGAMDKKTYNALKESDHPTITYNFVSSKPLNSNVLLTTGELSIAGQKKEVTMEVTYEIQPDVIVFSGELPLKMSDYGINPPTAMMGAIKTGDEVTIRFSFNSEYLK